MMGITLVITFDYIRLCLCRIESEKFPFGYVGEEKFFFTLQDSFDCSKN